ncbi:hypothetical protein [Cytobacillus kochii]|uniref:Uncharacterized protein n=1 Tax=Cytobacillus kochii TaxID=859143 RepID=A0A248TPJ5_9BACI|nr:hypothetical protein [Cytobacillus kochii]ASV70154.1 hypothetical protein CKF48_22975 [Cytobacillus kochii]
MNDVTLVFVTLVFICLGLIIIPPVFSKDSRYCLFKGILPFTAISFGMMILSVGYEDGIKYTVSSSFGYILFLFAILPLFSIVIYFIAYITLRYILKMTSSEFNHSKVIDYILGPIVFVVVNYYVYLEFL